MRTLVSNKLTKKFILHEGDFVLAWNIENNQAREGYFLKMSEFDRYLVQIGNNKEPSAFDRAIPFDSNKAGKKIEEW